MLRKLRITIASVFFICITLLFLDFTGTIHSFAGWMAKIQFLPSLFALNFIIVAVLLVLTLLFGRVYCSVICPLGVMQDLIGWMGKKSKKNRYSYSPAKQWLRRSVLALFALSVVLGWHALIAIIAPYSAYGRIAENLLAPIYRLANNGLAIIAEHIDSYAVYGVDVWIKSGITFAVALLTLGIVGFLAWRNGRTYCNTVCPVGTILGAFSRYSLFRPVIDTELCNGCRKCARNCKAACINPLQHSIDYSRCVACMDCLDVCAQNAIKYSLRRQPSSSRQEATGSGISRRKFLSLSGAIAVGAVAKAQNDTFDGGLAVIEDKKVPKRNCRLIPPGSVSIKNLSTKCTGCQLCVSACPNNVLRPSTSLNSFMQVEMSYEKGWCRPECTRCSEVCPTGAILPITAENKTAVRVGKARIIKENCLSFNGTAHCGTCAKRCPAGAIIMVSSDPDDSNSPKIPAVNAEKCIGCGACEHMCPSRPFSAIVVDGYEVHMEK